MSVSRMRGVRHELRLYVAGSTPRSLRAVRNLKRICDAAIKDHYDLEIIDAYKEPERLAGDQVIAIPTLIKISPGVVKRLIGDLSQEARVREGLDLAAV